MDLEKYRVLFVEEATEHLAEMSRAVVSLEKPGSRDEVADAIDRLFRSAHSIKGMAASLDYESVSALAHRLEDWMEPMREAAEFPSEALGLLYEALGALEQMVAEVSSSGAAPAARADLVEALGRVRRSGAGGQPAEPRPGERRKKARRPPHRSRSRSACAPMRSTGSWRRSES